MDDYTSMAFGFRYALELCRYLAWSFGLVLNTLRTIIMFTLLIMSVVTAKQFLVVELFAWCMFFLVNVLFERIVFKN